MAFNAGKYIKNTAKSSVERMVNNVVSDIVSGLPGSTTLITSSTAQTLFNIGASFDSVSAFASSRTDNIISGAADEFFAIAGRTVNRAAGVDLSNLRSVSRESLNVYLQQINPTTKIASKRGRDEYEILSVI